jgi:hypothetical protein
MSPTSVLAVTLLEDYRQKANSGSSATVNPRALARGHRDDKDATPHMPASARGVAAEVVSTTIH